MVDTGDRRALAGTAVVVALLHLAAFGALHGSLLPSAYQFGGERAVLVVAYLLGIRWAVVPGNAAAIGAAGRRLSGIGRRGVSSGFWFALGFAATVAGLAFLSTTGVRLLAWRAPQLAPGGDHAAVFLGLLAILQVVVLAGAVRARRDGRGPVPRPGLDRLIRWVRRAWQLCPIGAFFGLGLGIAAEIALLVLAAGPVARTRPFQLTMVLALLFAAGMCLTATLQGVFAADPQPARQIVPHIVFTAVAAAGALTAAILLNGAVDLQLVPGLVDDAQEQPAALADHLLDHPGLLLLLLLLVLVAVLAFRRSSAAKKNGPDVAGPPAPGRAARVRRALRERKSAGKDRADTPQAAVGRAPDELRRTPAAERVTGRASAVPAQRPADRDRPASGPAAPAPAPQASVLPAGQSTPYRQRVVARATVSDGGYPGRDAAVPVPAATGIAVVTGAGAGVGRAVALGLAGAGYGILAVDLDGDSAAACAAQARSCGVPAQALLADPRDSRYLERIVAVAEQMGRTSVLVNVGAGGWPSPVPGLTAGIRLSGLVREPMRLHGGGAVVNVVPAAAAEAQGLLRFTADSAGTRDGVRLMCLTTDQLRTAPAAVVAAVLDLIRRGSAGAVTGLSGAGPVPRFARGMASVV